MIGEFRGEYSFLSNMEPLNTAILTHQGTYAYSSEHAYQAAKFANPVTHRLVAHITASERRKDERLDGIAAKNLAHELLDAGEPLHPRWGIQMKLAVMETVVKRKFIANPDLSNMLFATGEQELVEGNDWGDRFWGVDPVGSDNGENQLGKILMHVRTTLKREVSL